MVFRHFTTQWLYFAAAFRIFVNDFWLVASRFKAFSSLPRNLRSKQQSLSNSTDPKNRKFVHRIWARHIKLAWCRLDTRTFLAYISSSSSKSLSFAGNRMNGVSAAAAYCKTSILLSQPFIFYIPRISKQFKLALRFIMTWLLLQSEIIDFKCIMLGFANKNYWPLVTLGT